MVWARIDDHIDDNPKIQGLDDPAFAAYVRGIVYCARNLTDGHIPATVIPALCRYKRPKQITTQLVDAGLWDVNGNSEMIVHDYLAYNPSRDEVLDLKAKRRAAGRAGAAKTNNRSRGT